MLLTSSRALVTIALVLVMFAIIPVFAETPPKAITFSLVDQDGNTKTEESFAERDLVVFFGYTHCPDICPTSAQHMASLLDALPPELKEKVVPVFITADPARDTPEKLKAFLASFDTRIVGLSGSLKAIDDLAWSMNVLIMRYGSADEGKNYMIDHSGDYLLVHKGRLLGRLPMTSTTDEIIVRLKQLNPQ